jgi:hypothetical protein
MHNVETLSMALDDLESVMANITSPLQEWLDLDGETDQDSKDQRRDAREEIESNIEELQCALRDACVALGLKDAE